MNRKTILAVDDDAINIDVYELLFGGDYHLVTALSGEEALEVAPRVRPDLILLDVMMPGMTGYEVCRKLREDPQLRFCKVLLVSAKGSRSERIEGYEAGADDYVTKPFCHDELAAKVRVYLKLKSVEQLDQLKTGVLGVLSHETRTPLQHILGAAELLRASADDLDAGTVEEMCTLITGGAERLERLVSRGLLLTEFRNGDVDLNREPMDAVAAIAHAVDKHRDAAARKNIEIRVLTPPKMMIEGDPNYFSILPDALLDNAVKFQRPGEPVTIELAESADDLVSLRVVDNGDGIDPTFLPHIFDGLMVEDVRHHSNGPALSLALCSAITDAFGGGIEVTSEPGKETSFVAKLRRAAES